MAADFWAGYASGAIGILIGNPLDLIKTRLQAGSGNTNSSTSTASTSQLHLPWTKQFEHWTALARGAAAPILGYGALNALLFMTYNRSLALINTGNWNDWPERPSAWSIWTAGAMGGLAIFFVSAPTELVKCRAQVSQPPKSSWEVTKELWNRRGVRGLYLGGGITSIRDSVGFGFYFWSYHLSRKALASKTDTQNQEALKVLLAGGVAGVITWASIYPLDMLKTRVQTWDLISDRPIGPNAGSNAGQPLLGAEASAVSKHSGMKRPSTFRIAQQAYRSEGIGVFFRGLGICSARAFIVNAVQWAVYEWMMMWLTR